MEMVKYETFRNISVSCLEELEASIQILESIAKLTLTIKGQCALQLLPTSTTTDTEFVFQEGIDENQKASAQSMGFQIGDTLSTFINTTWTSGTLVEPLEQESPLNAVLFVQWDTDKQISNITPEMIQQPQSNKARLFTESLDIGSKVMVSYNQEWEPASIWMYFTQAVYVPFTVHFASDNSITTLYPLSEESCTLCLSRA